MIIGLIILIALGLCLAGYTLFTQRKVYIHHTSSLSDASLSRFNTLSELDSWPRWLPWAVFDDKAQLTTSQRHKTSLSDATVQLKSSIFGTVSCHIATHEAYRLAFDVHSDRLYDSPLSITIELKEANDHSWQLNVIATSELSFWHRYKQVQIFKQVHADMYLLMVRLKSQMKEDCPDQLTFELQAPKSLNNLDAVTRPFIVSDMPMSMKMEQGFKALITDLGPDNPAAGPSFALYESADTSHHYFVGKLGIPIQCLSPCEAEPERITFKGLYLGLKFQGSYKNLWLAWHVLNTMARLHQYKRVTKRMSVEIYETSPRETTESHHFVTVLYLPIQ